MNKMNIKLRGSARGNRRMRRKNHIHPFPARMASSIALAELPVSKRKPLRVLDPMTGSGTTLIAARSRGHHAVGFDTDSLALILATVACSDIDIGAVTSVAHHVIKDASRRYRRITQGQAYPRRCDAETKKFIRFWFDPTNRRQLRALSDAISSVGNRSHRNVLWCAFSRLIIAKERGASLAMDLSHSRPHKVRDKSSFHPISNFMSAIKFILDNAPFASSRKKYPRAYMRKGDARKIPLPDSSIDIVITSPPYLNAIDYVRCHKFSLVWMHHHVKSLRALRSVNIGSSVSSGINEEDKSVLEIMRTMGNVHQLPKAKKRMLARYIIDMDRVIGEIGRILVKKGRCILVIGDCVIEGIFVMNSMAISKLGERHGLMTIKRRTRKLPENRRYLPPPSLKKAGKWMQARMRKEVVLTMQAA